MTTTLLVQGTSVRIEIAAADLQYETDTCVAAPVHTMKTYGKAEVYPHAF